MGVPLADVEGVAVGRGARDAPDTDAAAGAADIFDHDGLPERGTHPLGHDPGGGSVDPPGGNGTTKVMGREG